MGRKIKLYYLHIGYILAICGILCVEPKEGSRYE